MTKGLYKCGEAGCPGHNSFNESCSSVVNSAIEDYPILKFFQEGVELENPTEPVKPIRLDPNDMEKSGGRTTQEMKQYDNKVWHEPNPARKPR
jgi:hypothetical protein